MVDAAKRASAKTITVVAPFYGYARQDKKHRGREPISARLIADLFKTAGADRLMSVDLHAAQIQGFFDGPVDHLWAMPILTDYVRSRVDTSNVTVVSPDAGRIRVAEQWAAKLGGGPLAFVHKTRDIRSANQTVANRVVGDVEGRSCVLVDDLIDTGGTIAEAVRVILEAGAKYVIVAATHGVLSEPGRGAAAGLRRARGRRHRHPADRRRAPVPQAHGAVDRAAHRPRDPRGLRRRLGHVALRRQRLTDRPGRSGVGLAASSGPADVSTHVRPPSSGSVVQVASARDDGRSTGRRWRRDREGPWRRIDCGRAAPHARPVTASGHRTAPRRHASLRPSSRRRAATARHRTSEESHGRDQARRHRPHRVRQGRGPPHPPRQQDPRRPVRARRRPGARDPAGPRVDAGAAPDQRAALHRAGRQEPAGRRQGRPARPGPEHHRAHRPAGRARAARRSPSTSP